MRESKHDIALSAVKARGTPLLPDGRTDPDRASFVTGKASLKMTLYVDESLDPVRTSRPTRAEVQLDLRYRDADLMPEQPVALELWVPAMLRGMQAQINPWWYHLLSYVVLHRERGTGRFVGEAFQNGRLKMEGLPDVPPYLHLSYSAVWEYGRAARMPEEYRFAELDVWR